MQKSLTTRERFNRIMHRQKPDQVPNMDFGYWTETIKLWHKQGLPADIQTNQDMENYLGLEGVSIIPAIPVINGLYPPFESLNKITSTKLFRTVRGIYVKFQSMERVFLNI